VTQQAFTFAPKPPPPEPTLDEQAAEFVRDNPAVYRGMVSLAREKYEAGATRISAKLLFEEMRVLGMGGTNRSRHRLNNSLTAPMTRILIRDYPELAPLFELRARAAERKR
jgi:hypothetical protein